MWLSMNCTYKKVQHNKYCLFAFVCLLKMFIMLIFYTSLHICLSAPYLSMSASHIRLHFSLLCYFLINLRGLTGNVSIAQVYNTNLMFSLYMLLLLHAFHGSLEWWLWLMGKKSCRDNSSGYDIVLVSWDQNN